MRNYIIIISVGIILLVQACTFTTTTEKQPVFSVSTDSLSIELNRLVRCEHFNLNGAEITTNGKKETVLEVDVINGKNIPANDEAMIGLAKQIALQVKELITDKNTYTDYKVLFVTQSINGNTTKREWRGQNFKNEELKPLQQAVKAI